MRALALFLFAATAAAQSPSDEELPRFAVAGPGGFGLVSADGASMLATHWLLESDFRTFLNDTSPRPDRDDFALRFAGIRLDAILARNYHAQLFVNLAGNRVTVLEGWIEAKIAPWLRIRAGKFLYPISEERLTPQIALPFVSTSVSALLLPARDTGVELLGDVGEGLLSWNLAITNGAAAGSTGDDDGDSDKDVTARLFVRPFLRAGIEPLAKLGVGVGASTGSHTGTTDNPQLPLLATYGGLTFFSYGRTSLASGDVQRVVPHLTYAWGPFALYADAVWMREHVSGVEVPSHAFSAIASLVLTGENAAPLAFVVPAHPFDPSEGHPGLIELVFGAGEIDVGSEAFPAVADPTMAMRRMRVIGGGANWYLANGVAILLSYGHQAFAAAAGAATRPDEDTLVARLQLVL